MSLHEDVRVYVTACVASAERRLTSTTVADGYIKNRVANGEWVAVGDDQRSAEYGGVQQIVRPLLRTLVPEAPEPDDSQLGMDLPEQKLLQNRYSVRGEGNDEYYVLRTEMSEEEMQQVVSRFRGLSTHFARHAKALESSWYRDHSEVNA